MEAFKTPLLLRKVGGRYPWRLEAPLVYDSRLLGRIVIPAGYTTDFATVPRLPAVFFFVGGRAIMASVVHDWLYDKRPEGVSRRDADRVFLEAMKAVREPRRAILRYLMYLGVRVGGWWGWLVDSKHKTEGLQYGN